MSRLVPCIVPVRAMFAVLALAGLCNASAIAQDSFGGATGQRNTVQSDGSPLPQQYDGTQPRDRSYGPGGRPMDQEDAYRPPPPRGYDGNGRPPMQGASNEAQDFGVAPTRQLRPSQQLHGPTPTSIPGGKVIATQQLAQLMQDRQGSAMVLHAFGAAEHLPGAIPVGPAAQGGGFDDQVQREFGQYLRQATGGDQSRVLVFYCAGPQCWGSYNAALRAINMGYHNVYWYRGGIEAWGEAGLPIETAQAQGRQSQPQQPQAQQQGRQW